MALGRARIGTSGFHYRHWRGVFYPRKLPSREWFSHYARCFDTVEINNTFYRLPEEDVFDAWREQAPEGFSYALKFSRYGSHVKRLKQPRAVLRSFLGRARRLREHLGPILVQLPPRWRADAGRLDAFLAATPRSRRFAVEFRDPSWLAPDLLAVLRRHRAALCIHDALEEHPREVTADFVYLRFHGRAYGGSYSPQALGAEARRVHGWLEQGLDVHAYFNNDVGGHAVGDALRLRRYLGARAARGRGPS